MVSDGDLAVRLRGGDLRALPRLATLIENEHPSGLEALDALFPSTGGAHVVGITGPPGAGKSTLVAALIEEIRATERRVAVIAVDPSSTLTGGAVLGDRIRMMRRHADDGVFLRSMASRGRQGGLAWATAELVHLFDAAGFPLVLVETVGTGQDATDIASLADTVVVVEAPGLGDGVQAVKSGLLEVGDVVVLNKADQPGAEDALRLLRTWVRLEAGKSTFGRPILATTATTGAGAPELLAVIDRHWTWLQVNDELAARRANGVRAEVLTGLRMRLDRLLEPGFGQSTWFAEVIARVARREMAPRRAVEAMAAALGADRRAAFGGAIGDQGGGRTGADAVVDVDDDQARGA